MRTPWALFAVFAVGAAAGAAAVLLLRTGEVPRPAPEAPTSETSPAAVPASSDPGVAAREPFAPPAPLGQVLPGRTGARVLPIEIDAEPAEAAVDGVAGNKFLMLVSTGSVTKIAFSRLRPLGPLDTRVKELRSDAEAEDLLRRILANPSSEAAQEARGEMFGLANQLVSSGRDMGPLAEGFLRSPDPELRRAGVNLAQGTPPRVDILLAAASDPDPSVRNWALCALDNAAADGRVSAKDLEGIVLAALRDPVSEVRAAAMALLRWISVPGAAEAVRILRSGAHREVEAEAGPLVEAALAGAPAALLADPLPQHLAEDICKGLSNLPEERPDLVRVLAPYASALLAALAPGSRETAEYLLDALAAVGETSVLRQVLADPALAPRVRAEAADALSHGAAPAEWRPALASWLLDSRMDAQVRRQYISDHSSCYTRSEEDGDAAWDAWVSVLRAVAQGAEDSALAAEAAKALEDNERR